MLTDADNWRNGVIRRSDVADFIIEAAENSNHIAEAPVLISRGLLPFT